MEIAALAATLVSNFLLPVAKKVYDKVTGKVADELGEQAAEHAVGLGARVWGAVKGAFGSDEGKKPTFEKFEEKPDAFAPGLQVELEDLLRENDQLRQELEQMVTEPAPNGMSGVEISNTGILGIVNMQGARVSGTDIRIAGVSTGDRPPAGAGN